MRFFIYNKSFFRKDNSEMFEIDAKYFHRFEGEMVICENLLTFTYITVSSKTKIPFAI